MKRVAVLAAALAVVIACGGVEQEAPMTETTTEEPLADIVSVAFESAAVFLENEWVRVLRVTVEPGSEVPRHDASDRVVYALSDYTIEWTEGEAPPTTKSWTAGQAHWHESGAHAVRNIGESVAEYLVIERLGTALPAEAAPADDVQAAAPEHGSILLENDAVRVAEISLEPGQSTGPHPGAHRVVVALSDYTIQWTEGEADPVEVSWSEGDAHWHEPGIHEVENIGDGPARYLVVTLLQ